MNLQFYLEKLYESEEFKDFIVENPKAYLCSAFFAIDYEKSNNQQHLDFYVPSLKKIFSFKLEEGMKTEPLELYGGEVPKKIELDFDFDFDEIEKMIVHRMEKENVKNKMQKIMLSLQKVGNKELLTATVFVSNLGMLKINIEPFSKKIIDFEKKSFFDMLKFVGKKK